MKSRNVVIRGFLVVSCMIAFSGPTFAVAASKNHPFDSAFESQVSNLMLQDGRPSAAKINAYKARLQQKYNEIVGAYNGQSSPNSILIGAARMKGQVDDSFGKKLEESGVAIALRSAIADLEKMKSATSQEEFMQLAYNALDIENALRIEGMQAGLESGIRKVTQLLTPWRVSLKTSAQDEASNLFDSSTQTYLDSGRVAQLMASRVDLSNYGPKSSTFWQNQPSIANVSVTDAAMGKTLSIYRGTNVQFPSDRTVYFEDVRYSDTKPKLDVYAKSADGKKTKFKLKFGGELHADPTASALMMTLGFPADIFQYQTQIKLVLGKKTLSDLKRDWEIYYTRDAIRKRYPIEKYIAQTGSDESGNFVIFTDGLLQAKIPEIKRLGGWQFSDLGNESLREARALTVVQLWLENTDFRVFDNNKLIFRETPSGIERSHIIADLGVTFGFLYGEKPDLFKDTMVASRNDRDITFNYRSVESVSTKHKLTFSDVKWASRLIAGLTRNQIEQAVAIGHWPSCIQTIYVEKLIARRNDLVRNFNLEGSLLADGSRVSLITNLHPLSEMSLAKQCEDVKSLKEDFTTDFKFNLGYILSPVGKSAWNLILDQARGLAAGPKRIRLRGGQFDTRLQGIAEIIINPAQREIERNLNPTSENDLFLVKDSFEVGIRTGVSVGAYVDTVLKRVFTISYPARSMEEARVKNGFIFNALLVDDIASNRLPEKYVLKTEFYVEAGAGVEFDNKTAVFSPVVKAGVAKVRVLRTVLDHRDPNKILLFRDSSNFTQDQLELFARLAMLKIPLFQTLGQRGHAIGKAMTVTNDDVLRMPTIVRDMRLATINGNFSAVQEKERNLYVQNDFQNRLSNWGFLLWKGSSERRVEYITLRDENNADNSRTIIQGRSARSNSTNFFENKEVRAVKVQVYSNATAGAGSFSIDLSILGSDAKTNDRELSTVFLSFINGFSTTGQRLINFTPELGYSTNKTWGSTITQSVTQYYQAGIDRVLAVSDANFIRALSTNVRHQLVLTTDPVTPEERDENALIRNTRRFLKNLKGVNHADSMEKKVKRLAELFREAVFVKSNGFYDSRVVGAINRIAGLENLYARHVISAPHNKEQNMIEGTPLFAEVGRERPEQRQYVMYAPQTASDLYFMFDSWF